MTGKVIKISEMPPGKTFEDYPEDTIFVLDEEDEDGWDKYDDGDGIRFSELPDDVKIEDFPSDTILILDDDEPELHDEFWDKD